MVELWVIGCRFDCGCLTCLFVVCLGVAVVV